MDPKNYIELEPRLYTTRQPLVIQAVKIGTALKVIAPGSFLMRWPTVKANGWKEVDCEVGPVTVEKWRLLVGEGAL
jgi:hypothetical protein